MLDPALGEGLPASHLGAPTTLRAKYGYQRRVLCHGSTPSRLCLGGSAVPDSEGIRRASSLVEVSYHRSPQAVHTGQAPVAPLDSENGHFADILAGTWCDTPTGKTSWASRKANPPNL